MTDPRPLRELTWLAAFPKSGSTWLRFILHHLLHGPPARSADVNARLPSVHDDDASLWRPAVGGAGGVVLTHLRRPTHRKMLPDGDALIILTRHPLDVMASAMSFFALTQLGGALERGGLRPEDARPEHADQLANAALQHVLRTGTLPAHSKLGYGSWGENVGSWLGLLGARPGLLLRFEDLKRAPLPELRRLCAFLGRPVTDDRLTEVIAATDVGAMRGQQEREIAAGERGRFYNPDHQAGYRVGLRFVRAGGLGAGMGLPAPVRSALCQRFSAEMAVLGYRPDVQETAPLLPQLRKVVPLQAETLQAETLQVETLQAETLQAETLQAKKQP